MTSRFIRVSAQIHATTVQRSGSSFERLPGLIRKKKPRSFWETPSWENKSFQEKGVAKKREKKRLHARRKPLPGDETEEEEEEAEIINAKETRTQASDAKKDFTETAAASLLVLNLRRDGIHAETRNAGRRN